MNLLENSTFIKTSKKRVFRSRFSDTKVLPINSIIFPKRGAAIATNKKRMNLVECVIDNNCMAITIIDQSYLNPYYLFYFMLNFDLSTITNQTTIPLINNGNIQSLVVPVPSLKIQNLIVEKLEEERKIIEGTKN